MWVWITIHANEPGVPTALKVTSSHGRHLREGVGISLSGMSISLNTLQGQHAVLSLAVDAHSPSLGGMQLALSICIWSSFGGNGLVQRDHVSF